MNTVTLELSADSVECHPVINNLMTVGTYQIDQEHEQQYKERRSGKLYLFDVNCNNDASDGNTTTSPLKQLQVIDFNSGILDMKWSKTKDFNPKLAVVLSRGDLALYSIESTDDGQHKLESLAPATLISPTDEILALSCDWNVSGTRLITSYSDGSIALINMELSSSQQQQQPEVIERWDAHGYEAWIAAFYYHQEQLMFSGGDDCLWKHWDSRVGLSSPTLQKRCDMGVTSIHCNPHRENLVAVGSYDENVRVWDLRAMRQPLSTTALGGGVWRVKWHPSAERPNELVTACMGGGFHRLTFNKDDNEGFNFGEEPEILSYKGEHQSIAYGVDWSSQANGENQYIGCCSFYDKLLSIWKQ